MCDKKIVSHYSGKKSKKFWNKINNDLGIIERNELYSLGVCLQNLEGFVLKRLSECEPKKKKCQKQKEKSI